MKNLKSRELIGHRTKTKADIPGHSILLVISWCQHIAPAPSSWLPTASWLEYSYIPYHFVIQYNLSYGKASHNIITLHLHFKKET